MADIPAVVVVGDEAAVVDTQEAVVADTQEAAVDKDAAGIPTIRTPTIPTVVVARIGGVARTTR